MQRLLCIMSSYRQAAVTLKMELVHGYVVVDCLLMMNSLPIRNT